MILDRFNMLMLKNIILMYFQVKITLKQTLIKQCKHFIYIYIYIYILWRSIYIIENILHKKLASQAMTLISDKQYV
jgi:hypothetical protein